MVGLHGVFQLAYNGWKLASIVDGITVQLATNCELILSMSPCRFLCYSLFLVMTVKTEILTVAREHSKRVHFNDRSLC